MNRMSITELQKQHENLETLNAFRQKYNEIKCFRIARIIITYLLTFGFPLISYYYTSEQHPNLKPILGSIGALYAFVSFWIIQYEKKGAKHGAQLQEVFDTSVFSLAWNNILVGEKPSKETIYQLSNRFNGTSDEKWYGNLEGIPHPYNILICQRNNVVWDWRLRQNYIILLSIVLITLFIGQAGYSLYLKLTLADFLTGIFLPSLAAYILGLRELIEHIDNRNGKRSMESKITKLIDNLLVSKQVDENSVRQIQDAIYILRRCPAIIPNWFSEWFNPSYEERMNKMIKDYKVIVLSRLEG